MNLKSKKFNGGLNVEIMFENKYNLEFQKNELNLIRNISFENNTNWLKEVKVYECFLEIN